MPFNVLLLPLLGGYIFVSNFNLTRYKMRRQSGRKVLFDSALVGVFLLGIGVLSATGIDYVFPSIKSYWKTFAPFDYSGASAIALAAGFLGYQLGNQIWSREYAVRKGVDDEDDYFEELIIRSLENAEQVSVTLNSGKVYVGIITCGGQHAYDRQFLRLWPMASGYRDPETKEMVLTTYYAPVYKRLYLDEQGAPIAPEDFEVVIPSDSIEIASIFDPTAYALFEAEDSP